MRLLMVLATFTFSLNILAADIGVVFLHAKGSRPDASTISYLINEMRSAGMEVSAPEMPWSGSRNYDASYSDAMDEIQKEVNKLKAGGAKSLFIAGHSLGANGAIGYGAHKGGVDGVVAIAPGHVPELRGYRKKLKGSPAKAANMIEADRGNEKADFNDFNQGDRSTINTTASIYDSYFSDEGPAVMPANVTGLKPPAALLWVVGEDDRMAGRGEGYAYANAPENSNNKYLVVSGGHKDTPEVAKFEIVEWIKKVHASKK